MSILNRIAQLEKRLARVEAKSSKSPLDVFNTLDIQFIYFSGSKSEVPYFSVEYSKSELRKVCPADSVVIRANTVILYGPENTAIKVNAKSPSGVTCADLIRGMGKVTWAGLSKAYPRVKTDRPGDAYNREDYFEGLSKYRDGYRVNYGS